MYHLTKFLLTQCNSDLLLLQLLSMVILLQCDWLLVQTILEMNCRRYGIHRGDFVKVISIKLTHRYSLSVLLWTFEMQLGSLTITKRHAFSRQQRVEIPARAANVTEKSTLMHLSLVIYWTHGGEGEWNRPSSMGLKPMAHSTVILHAITKPSVRLPFSHRKACLNF